MFDPFSPKLSYPSSRWLSHAVFALDGWLRTRQGVYEYTNHPSCIFRVQPAQAELSLTLSDGTHIAVGDAIIDLHLWNEHVPFLGQKGASVAWGRQLGRMIEFSLIELAKHVAGSCDLSSIVAVRADMRLGAAEKSRQLVAIASHYGFEAVPLNATIKDSALHHIGENILSFLLVLATNPVAVRASILRRGHVVVFLSRQKLLQYYQRDYRRAAKAVFARGALAAEC